MLFHPGQIVATPGALSLAERGIDLLALIDAPQAGTGKTLLGEIVARIATGYSPTMMPFSRNSSEWRKKITSTLMADASVIIIDNINDELNSEILASALTSREWGDRKLGTNDIVRVQQLATWIANGNNIHLGGDLPRRCYQIRLDAEMSRPWQRDKFQHPNILEWVDTKRTHLISAILVLARAWVVAGKPTFNGPIMGGFTEWENVIGGILSNAGVTGFLENLLGMYNNADEEGLQWEAFLLALYERYEGSWVTTADICEDLKLYTSLGDLLPDEFESPFDNYGVLRRNFNRQLGGELKKRVETRYGTTQVHLKRDYDSHRKVAKWRIVCGDAGVCGVSSTPRQIPLTDFSLIKEGEVTPAIPANPAELGPCHACGVQAWVERSADVGGGVYCGVCHPGDGKSLMKER